MHSNSILALSGKITAMIAITALAGWGADWTGLAPGTLPVISVCTFVSVICTTLFFWPHRIAIAFLGVAVLIGSRAMTLHGMLRATELDIIFFLIGMMVIVGALKDLGFLTWVIQSILNKKRMTGLSFTFILCILSALLSGLLGEVSSIVIVLALVFQVCDTLKVRTSPFVLIAVLSTNIGSAATMLGNPVGIFIGNKAGLSFNQFLTGAFPIAAASLAATLLIMLIWYRKDIRQLAARMEEHRQSQCGLAPLFRIPHKRGVFVLMATVCIIAFHHQLENIFGLTGIENKNAFLIITPLVIAAFLMLSRPERAHHDIDRNVEWHTLLFFMLLFAIAGGLREQGVTQNMADKLVSYIQGVPSIMVPFVLMISSIGSAFMDNIVFVAAFTPVIQSLLEHSADYAVFWWALLFGACFGGNITAVGSTANIIALGMLEKRGDQHIGFFEWLKIGLVVSVVTGLIAWAGLTWLPVQQAAPPPAAAPQAMTSLPAPLPPGSSL